MGRIKSSKLSEEHKRNIGNAIRGSKNGMFGKKHKLESRLKMGRNVSKENNPFYKKHHTKDTRDRISNTVKKLYLNKDFLRKYQEDNHLKPNKAEILLSKFLNKLFPNSYKYVGNHSFWIEGKNPDFVSVTGTKRVIELFGDYWHKDENPQNIIKHYNKNGYATLVIWESELKDLNKLTFKLELFQKKDIVACERAKKEFRKKHWIEAIIGE